MAKQGAKDAYNTAKSDIARLLGFFAYEIKNDPENINWLHVDCIYSVRQNLIDALAFLTGLEHGDVEDALAQSRRNVRKDK